MPLTARPPARPSPAAGPSSIDAPRSIRPRRGLPGTRAVVGGLLVAVAALGTFAVTTGAGRHAVPRYVVARRPIAAGQRIQAGDLASAPIDLPGASRQSAFGRIAAVAGAVALGPIQPGE
ncbi:MAG TPA: SAF domain-containing protein, partial [Acidimicrobiales bacterium]